MITVHYNPQPLYTEDIMGARYSIHAGRIILEEDGMEEIGYILLRHAGGESDWVEVYLGDSQPIPGEGFYGDMVRDCVVSDIPPIPVADEIDWEEYFQSLKEMR